MSSLRLLSLPLVLGCLLAAGCGSKDDEPVAPKDRKGPDAASQFGDPSKDPLAELPNTVRADALKVGPSLGPDGAAVPASAPFGMADTVHVSFPTRGLVPSAPVIVYWTYQDGRTHHIERSTLPASGEQAVYRFAQAQGMKPGQYNVEVQVNNRPIGISDFVVR